MELFTIVLIWTLPLVSGMADAASRSVIKIASKLHDFTLLSVGLLFALPFYLIWLFFTGMPIVENGFWVAIALHVPLFTGAMILMVEAHKASGLASTMPYMALTPAFLLGVTPFLALFFSELGGSSPTLVGGLGVLVLVAGLYVLNMQTRQQSILSPVRAFWHDRGSRLMFFASIILAFTATFDLVALKNIQNNVPFYLLVDHGLLSIIMALLILAYSAMKWEKTLPFSPRGFWKSLFFFGCFTALAAGPHNLAFTWIPIVPYVIAVKRAGAILFGVLALGLVMGMILNHPKFQDDKKNLRFRIPGTIIAVIGMVIIIIWGKA
ncbi:MAG: hypothetical protein Q8O83_04850 [bacterium]|nr:hypothetical protein [bacterium]